MEAYGDQAAAASNQFCCKSREEPSRVVQLARSDRGHSIITNYFSRIDKGYVKCAQVPLIMTYFTCIEILLPARWSRLL